MPIYALGDLEPTISASAFVHPDAVVIGRVTLGDDVTIWPGAVLRGDYNAIEIGPRTSIQDGTIVHVAGTLPTLVGSNCVVGHNAYIEGCTIEEGCLIGSGSVVLNFVTIGRGAVVAAGAVVRERATVPPGMVVAGVPAEVRGSAQNITERISTTVELYVENGRRYARELRRID